VEEKGNLGILLSAGSAVAVWTSADGSIRHTRVIAPDADEPVAPALQAARAVMRQGFAFDAVSVAVDCGSYTQYDLHSEFADVRQIESTIKFDAEEAAAADAMNLAVTFEVTGTDEHGSQVTVYTADRQYLTDVLLDLQEGGMDPTVIEPDVVCLTRALEQTSQLDERAGTLFVVLSGANCYMIIPNAGFAPVVRTFLVPDGKSVTTMLTREVLLATAAGRDRDALTALVLIGQADRVDPAALASRTGLDVRTEEPERQLGQTLTDDGEMTCGPLLIAYGAALAEQSRRRQADFRRDYMPYQGKRKLMEGSLRLIGIAVTVLLLAVGVYFQARAFRVSRYASRLEQKMLDQYKAVMYGKAPLRGASPSTMLKRELAAAQREKDGGGPGDSRSAPAKLTYFLEVLNGLPKQVDVQLQSVNVTERSMKVKGDTNSRTSTRALIDAVKAHASITVTAEQIRPDGGRDSFDISVEPK
jgi:hypothetical protein